MNAQNYMHYTLYALYIIQKLHYMKKIANNVVHRMEDILQFS